MWFKGRVTEIGEHCFPSLLLQELHPPHLPRCITSNMISGWNPPSLLIQTTRSTTRISCESVSVCHLTSRHHATVWTPQPAAPSRGCFPLFTEEGGLLVWEQDLLMSHSDFVMLSFQMLHSHSTLPRLSSDVLLLKPGLCIWTRCFSSAHNVQLMDMRSRIWQKVHWMTLAPR